MVKRFLLFFSPLCITAVMGQSSYTVTGKKDYSFTETSTTGGELDMLTADEIKGFSFDPIRNKAVVELHFRVPNINRYELIIVEHGDSVRGFTPCLTINIKDEKLNKDSFIRIDRYPLPYTQRTFYRAKSVTADGIIRFFPYVLELHDGDKESMEKHRMEMDKQFEENKKKEEELLRSWEENKNKPIEESWRNAKPEILSGSSAISPNVSAPPMDWDENRLDYEKKKIEKKLERVKEIEEDLKKKLDELKSLLED